MYHLLITLYLLTSDLPMRLEVKKKSKNDACWLSGFLPYLRVSSSKLILDTQLLNKVIWIPFPLPPFLKNKPKKLICLTSLIYCRPDRNILKKSGGKPVVYFMLNGTSVDLKIWIMFIHWSWNRNFNTD